MDHLRGGLSHGVITACVKNQVNLSDSFTLFTRPDRQTDVYPWHSSPRARVIIVLTIHRIMISISEPTQKRCNNMWFSGRGYLGSLYILPVFSSTR